MRRFNRLVTERVGALEDRFLARGRPLGEARLLWEIGREGSDVRRLRARLGLDSGYTSRLLRALEAAGLVTVVPGAPDRRVRTARLTRRGDAELAILDRRADDLARSLLDPLSASGRTRLVAAMAEVERLLTAGLVELTEVDPHDPRARFCLDAYAAELALRFESGWDPAVGISADPAELVPPNGRFVLATLRGEPVGCGALKLHGAEPAELKRMWVATEVRGLGVGRRLLAELERLAASAGARTLRLETNRVLGEAIGLYRSAGFREVDAFNDEPYAHYWFEKTLAPPREGRHTRRGAGAGDPSSASH